MITHPLYDPIHAGEFAQMRAWLDQHPEDLNADIGDGYYALHVACLFGHENLVQDLLNRQVLVNINARNDSRATPLHLAVSFRDEAVAERVAAILLANGAELNAMQDLGQTPLHHAVARGSAKLTHVLIDAGADPFLKDQAGKSPVDLAKVLEGENAAVIRAELKRVFSLTLESE